MTYRKNATDRLHARIVLNSSFLSPSSGYSAFSSPTCVSLPLYAVALLDRYRNSKSTPRCAGWFSMIASRRKQIRKAFNILCEREIISSVDSTKFPNRAIILFYRNKISLMRTNLIYERHEISLYLLFKTFFYYISYTFLYMLIICLFTINYNNPRKLFTISIN